MEQIKDYQQEQEKDIKIFKLTWGKMINEIQKSPEDCLKQITLYLPELHQEKLTALVDEYR